MKQLHFLSLEKDDDPAMVVDLELYDHGTVDNALGAYNGERGGDTQPEVSDSGLTHYDRNALYMTLGRYYLRAVGSDESAPILAQLKRVRSRFAAELKGEPLPWSYALFIGKMGFKPGALSYFPENAFNFSFAKNVNVARLEDDTELFVIASDASSSVALARTYVDGFRGYGEDVEPGWVQDQYIQTIATAQAQGAWVVGVRGAPNIAAAKAGLARLQKGLDGFAVPNTAAAAAAPSADEGYAEGEGEPTGTAEGGGSDAVGEGEGESTAGRTEGEYDEGEDEY